jgi:20S proteasome alpha/beta subunit
LTLIVGATCTDGTVIVGDTKLTDTMGTLLRYEPKLAGVLRNVIFGYAGAVDMYKIFERYIAGDVIILRDSPDKYTSDNLVKKTADAMHVLLVARSRQFFELRVMVGRQFPNNGKSDLHLVDSKGRIEPIKSWKAIGDGQLDANPIIERKWKENMSMKEFGQLGYCIIKYIEKQKPEGSVGGEPSIKYQKDAADLDTIPSIEEIKEFQKASKTFSVR